MATDLQSLSGPIDANGDYYLDVPDKAEVALDVAGTFGGRTVTMIYQGVDGGYYPATTDTGTEITLTSAGIRRVLAGQRGRIGINVSGSDAAPSLRVGWRSITGADYKGAVPSA